MTGSTPPEHDWTIVNDIFHRALDQPTDAREAFLDRVCAGQPGLRAELASLLAAHKRADDFIEQPAGSVVRQPSDAVARLNRGDALGAYTIDTLVGEGGMGIVYRAHDTRLGRVVAIKAVAPQFTGDEGRRERLRREARAAAALNHPGIATVFALEEIDGELYIASEFVPGESLRDELQRRRPSLGQVLDTGIEIARALAAAHEGGVVHRDLKPENVMRAESGHIKILDFGVARLETDVNALSPLTADGSRLGTPAYMAPEQIRGEVVDFRADLFAFGILLMEFSAGVHPFAASTPTGTIAKILEAEPPSLATLRGDAPGDAGVWRELQAIVSLCLHKSPKHRFLATRDLVSALEGVRRALVSGEGSVTPAPPARPTEAAAGSTLWWWQFHQTAASVAYLVLLVPLSYARESDHDKLGLGLFFAGLVAALSASTLRLHLWFTSRWYPAEWAAQRRRSRLWLRLADSAFVVVLLGAAFAIATAHATLATLFVASAVAVLLAFAIIEPATTRAAFGDKNPVIEN